MRVALVGLGNAGLTLHLPALAGLPGATVVGVCDTDVARHARAVAASGGAPAFADVDAMLAAARPDVLIVATPPDTHADYCRRALAAGAHVLCEKPFVSSVREADEVLAAAAAAGRRVALNHEFRAMPIFQALLDATPPSEVVFAQAWQLMDLPPWAEPGWRGRMLQRTLYEAGVHLVDFLLALFGELPHAVTATTSTCGVRDGETDAVALVTLEFSRGRLAQIVQNRLCKGETQYFEVRAETPAASLRASFGGRARVTAGLHRSTRPHVRLDFGIAGMAWREVGGRRTPLARNPRDPGMVATRNVLARTFAAFRDGTAPPASGEDGRDVLRVIAAAYLSANTGRRVALDAPEAADAAELRMGAAPPAMPAAIVVGAGLMGRWHAAAVRHAGRPVRAIVDPDLVRARALAERYPGARAAAALHEVVVPDHVVHVCTPPASHVALAAAALDAGCHALVEKPLAPSAADTAELLERARRRGRMLVPVHQCTCQHGAERAAALLPGLGPVLHADAIACTAGADGEGDAAHDRLTLDVLPHALSLLARLLSADVGDAAWSAVRGRAGELRATGLVARTTVSIVVSTHGRPTRHALRLVCARGTLHLDLFHGHAVLVRGGAGRAGKIALPFVEAGRALAGAAANLAARAARGETAYPGLRTLVARTYAAAETGGPPPIATAETLAVARAVDRIAAQVAAPRDGAAVAVVGVPSVVARADP